MVYGPCGQFSKLDQTVLCGGWIEKRDAAACVTDAWHLVEQGNAFRFELGKCFIDVLHLEADVIETAFTVCNHARKLAVGCRAGEQLHHRVAHRIKREPPYRRFFDAAERNAEAVFPQLAAC